MQNIFTNIKCSEIIVSKANENWYIILYDLFSRLCYIATCGPFCTDATHISMSEILIFIKKHFVLDLHWYKCFGVHNRMIAVRWLIQKYIWTWCSNDVSSCTSRSVECGGKCILKLTDYIAARKKYWLKSILHTFTYKQLIFLIIMTMPVLFAIVSFNIAFKKGFALS